MLKIEASTLEIAYKNAADQLECSITQLKIEVVQVPSKGFLGLFKKSAIIVAIRLDEQEKKEPQKIKKEETPKKSEIKKPSNFQKPLKEKVQNEKIYKEKPVKKRKYKKF
ncbi:MAG: Jag N-terminal domain-containing protein [Sulfurimonas sp.]|nr:Jag N-terminal domain-containing protein [Sulfurimonas sp.]